jgi:hypothetical protein
MLQRFLLITFTLCSLTASAQWQQTGSKVRYVNGLGIPTKDTAAGVSADSSQIVIRPADSSLYVKYKRTWIKVGGGTVSGTTNYVSKFTSSTALGNSQIFDNGTNVGISTTVAEAKLHVSGTGSSLFTIGQTGSTAKQTIFGHVITGNGYTSIQSVFQNTEFTPIALNINGGNVGVGTENNGSDGGLTPRLSVAQKGNTNKFVGIGYDSTGDYGFVHSIHRATAWKNLSLQPVAGNVGIGYTAPAAKLSVNGTTLINTNTDNGVDKLQVSGSMNVSAKATALNISATNNLSITNDINQGSGTANANYTIVANGTSSGWAGRIVGEYATGQFYFQHRNNSPTFTTCFSLNANGGKGGTTFLDNAFIGGDGWLTVNGSTNNGVDKLQVVGSTISTQYKLSALNTAPATASSTGTLGEIRIDANYIYICTATNTWKRVAIATW